MLGIEEIVSFFYKLANDTKLLSYYFHTKKGRPHHKVLKLQIKKRPDSLLLFYLLFFPFLTSFPLFAFLPPLFGLCNFDFRDS